MLTVYLIDSKSSWIYVLVTLKDSSFLIRIVKKNRGLPLHIV